MAAGSLSSIQLDVDDILFSCLDDWSPMSLASTTLSARYGQWLVRRYRFCIESLDKRGFSDCKVFLRHGGFDVDVGSTHFEIPPGGDISFPSRPSQEIKVRPLEIVQNMSRHRFLDEPYPMLSQETPSFTGALLSEFFQRLKDNGECYAEVFEEMDKKTILRMQALLPDDPYSYATEFHEGLASSIASVPLAVACRCGLQQWFLKVANLVIHRAASSTKMFLNMMHTCPDSDSDGYKFMTVLASAAHCGLKSEDSTVMLEECISTVINDKDTLMCEIGSEGISLRQMLCLLAMTPFARKRGYLDVVLKAARKRAVERAADERLRQPEDAFHYLCDILVNGQCDFHPKLGFNNQERWKIHKLKETLISLYVDEAGRSMLSEFNHYHCSFPKCYLGVLHELWNMDLEFGPADGFYFEGRPHNQARLRQKIEHERSKRQEWIDRFLAGVIAAYRGHQVVFSSEDAEQVRNVGQQHPALMLRLEDFVNQMLAMRRP